MKQPLSREASLSLLSKAWETPDVGDTDRTWPPFVRVLGVLYNDFDVLTMTPEDLRMELLTILQQARLLVAEHKYETAEILRGTSMFKQDARALTKEAIRKKRLVHGPCEVCGEPRVATHHWDYGDPFDPIWLCALHHTALHHGRLTEEEAIKVEQLVEVRKCKQLDREAAGEHQPMEGWPVRFDGV